MNSKLQKLHAKTIKAEGALRKELEKQFPRGTTIEFNIMHGQKHPNTGVVSNYHPGGILNVKHDQAKERSRYLYRRVRFDYAIPVN